jgi:hypothetical protein
MVKPLFDGSEANRLIARARAELEMKTHNHLDTWGLATDGRWDADLETGIITFTTGRGWIATAPVQVIGTYYASDSFWLWAWDHPTLHLDLAQDAWRSRKFGERYGLEAYTTAEITCTMEDAWNFTAIACHLSEAQGGYCGQEGDAKIFMTFGELQFRDSKT